MKERTVEPHLFIILGATGDLTRRKLLPALFHLRTYGELEEQNTLIVGAALPELSQEAFRLWAYEGLGSSGSRHTSDLRQWCDDHVYYQPLREGKLADYEALAKYIAQFEVARNLPQNRIFYLALPPTIVPATLELLDQTGLLKSHGWVRVVFEKPFGHDFHSARSLNTLLHRYLEESQIYRIDHYLGKETVQNLLAFRFANNFESLWNRDTVESVEITVAEDLGVEHRGAYYQGPALCAIWSRTIDATPDRRRHGSADFLEAPRFKRKNEGLAFDFPIHSQDVIFGQYAAWDVAGQRIPGYLEEQVYRQIKAETYVALKLRFTTGAGGVPFFENRNGFRARSPGGRHFPISPIQVFRSLEPDSLNPNKF